MLTLMACGPAAPVHPRAERSAPCTPGMHDTVGDDLSFECIARGVWMFTALAPADFEYPRYPANGLVIEAADQRASGDSRLDHAILIDTGWSDAQAEAILAWSVLPITAALVTHFHDDRTGGARALMSGHIPVFGTARTIELATARGEPVPDHELLEGSLPEVRWYYPGPAHSPDNIVVWHEASGTLFGGCMIKELAAESLGNVADADLMSWLSAMDGVMGLFGEPRIVVPGHGTRGDAELLTHTLVLLGPRECTSAADCVVTIETLEPCACCSCVEPRALSLAAIERARARIFSCDPICEHECPACMQAPELATYGAACELGACVLRAP